MTASLALGTPPRRHLEPWSPHAWVSALYLAGAIPVQVAGLLIPAVVFRETSPGRMPAGWPSWTRWPIVLFVVFLVLPPVLTTLHRHRLRATAGIGIPPGHSMLRWWDPRRVGQTLGSQATWRQLCYHLLAAPALAVAATGAFGAWLAGILYTFVYTYAWALPPESVVRRGLAGTLPLGLPVDAILLVCGLALLWLAPRLTYGVRTLDAEAARALLGPSRADELEHRVEHLTQTRAGVVDAADAERRRLERDLHDGTQQRLVSLAMNLGMARAQAGTFEAAREAISEAHEEAKAALAELRDLIRGLHPAVLEDRGLDAALSGVTARMPVPVRLTVDLPRRPDPVIEAVAYFVVSEGLANVAKHSRASQAEVFVRQAGDRLHVIVSDDGVGGASPERGTGLAGLAKRASSVDGTLDITSPQGGPTLLTLDLPCAR